MPNYLTFKNNLIHPQNILKLSLKIKPLHILLNIHCAFILNSMQNKKENDKKDRKLNQQKII